jgi:hypothetical protein
MMHLKSVILVPLVVPLATYAAPTSNHPRAESNYNDGIHLAIKPTCGTPSINGSVVDVNAGLRALAWYKTIVSFGDSFTSNGKFDGSKPDPPVQVGTSPRVSALGACAPMLTTVLVISTGDDSQMDMVSLLYSSLHVIPLTTSLVWIENLANDTGAQLLDYAVSSTPLDAYMELNCGLGAWCSH